MKIGDTKEETQPNSRRECEHDLPCQCIGTLMQEHSARGRCETVSTKYRHTPNMMMPFVGPEPPRFY